MNKVLVVVAHADDEVLGCGGTIARLCSEGKSVHVVYMTDGVGARGVGAGTVAAIQARSSARDNALAILGVSNWSAFQFPDNQMDNVSLLSVVQALEPIVQSVKPDTVLTHHYGDLNVDHQMTHQAVMTACRPLPDMSVKQILVFEVMSSTEWSSPRCNPFIPDTYVDISHHIDAKCDALRAYQLEMRPEPHSRSNTHIVQLTRHRGSCVGVSAAEAFVTIRSII